MKLKNTTVGAKAFLKPNERSKISVNLNSIQEYRRGGDRLDLAPQFTDITEEKIMFDFDYLVLINECFGAIGIFIITLKC